MTAVAPPVTPCIACGSTGWDPLPVIPRGILGDGRVLDAPIVARHCSACGLRAATVDFDLEVGAFSSYDPASMEAAADARARLAALDAEWLLADGPSLGPGSRFFDIGGGDGALLAEIARRVEDARLDGIEPSAVSVARAAERGVGLRLGFWPDGVEAAAGADLLFSVNVLEHVPSPVAFLRSVAAALSEGGQCGVVVPDGDQPGVDMLVADHRWTFTRTALTRLAARAGMTCRIGAPAPFGRGPFLLAWLGRGGASPVPVLAPGLYARRRRFLTLWTRLDESLHSAVGPAASPVLFGAGEGARLLIAFAPTMWERVVAITQDRVPVGTWRGRPWRPLDTIAPGTPVLLGIQAHHQPSVAARLAARGLEPIRWDDLVVINPQ